MGAHPYWYFVPYEKNIQHALDLLRKREFEAGRYRPVVPFPQFDEPMFSEIRPGPQHATIEQAVRDAGESGTASILDVPHVGDEPDFGVAGPLGPSDLRERFSSDRPTRKEFEEKKDELFEDLERGQCVYVVLYRDGKPTEIVFAGYSYD